MPIFGSKFSPKKTAQRKVLTNESIDDLFEENHSMTLKLGQLECIFENGVWTPENISNGNIYKDTQKLKSTVQDLQEENNVLKLKYELLLHMLTTVTAENHTLQREIKKMGKQ